MNSKPIESELDFEPTSGEIVFAWMDVIEKYRKVKKTLPQIHAALLKKPDFSLSFSSFKHHYYQLRKERSNESPPSTSVPSNGRVSSSVVIAEPVPESRKPDIGSYEKKSQEVSQSPEFSEGTNAATKSTDRKTTPPFKRIEIGGSMEEREAIARALFNQ